MLTVADILEALCGIRPSRGNQVITDAVIRLTRGITRINVYSTAW